MSGSSLRDAYVSAGGGWQRLPEWAVWFAEAGRWAAELSENGANAVVAMSVPAREYAAVLLAFGSVDRASSTAPEHVEPELGFEQARTLQAGTCVRVAPVAGPEDGRRAYTGLFQGAVENRYGKVYELSGRPGPGGRPGMVSWFPADRYRLQVLSWPDLPDDYADRNRFSEVFEVPSGAGDLLTGRLDDFYGQCSLDCVLVGVATTVLAEAQEIIAAPGFAGLSLRELMRLRGVQAPGTHYRSVVLSSRSDPQEYRDVLRSRKPAVTVLDGAATVRRWMAAGLTKVTVAVVERTSPSAMAAAEVLYANRARSPKDLNLPARLAHALPAGVEALAWQNRERAR
ncbi:hypothetical protein [Streptomyces sp. NBC_01643]|uniref:hypothetical protein n=1 Tax=Streptomyces sp. NBC_01643 TaxID=2975906 RepID=UPI00387013BE|nr:hypothetical protein OHB03_16375 [Streptomyces sp. NBC_01643]